MAQIGRQTALRNRVRFFRKHACCNALRLKLLSRNDWVPLNEGPSFQACLNGWGVLNVDLHGGLHNVDLHGGVCPPVF